MARLRRIAIDRSNLLDPRTLDLGPGPVPIGISPERAWEEGRKFPGLERAFTPSIRHVEQGILPDGYYLLDA